MQCVKTKSRIQNYFKTEMSDYESNPADQVNTLEYYESPRLNQLNNILSHDRKYEANMNTVTKSNA